MAVEGVFSYQQWWIQVFIILLTAIFAIRLYARHAYSYWRRKGIPSLQPSFPFGNIKENILLRRSTGDVMAELYNAAGDNKYIGLYTFFQPFILLKDLDVVKNVLVKDFSYFVDRGVYYNEVDDPCSAHLFSLEGQKWKNLRSRLSPTFTTGKMKMMFSSMDSCVRMLENYFSDSIKGGEDLDVKDVFKRFSLSVIANIALGIDVKNLGEDNEFTKMAFQVTEPNFAQYTRVTFAMLCRNISQFLRLRILPKVVGEYFVNTIGDIIAYREKTHTKRNDFMQILIDLKNGVAENEGINNGENLESITFNELVAQVFVFIVAGYETGSTTLSYCLYELAVNKDIQSKLRKEVKNAGDVSYETLNDLPYMEMVLNETLRNYPPVSYLQRVCLKDYQLDEGQVIKAGTLAIVPVRAIQHDPQFFPDPEQFNPERFNKNSPVHPILPFTFLPFGEGPRYCVGMRFGKLQAKLTLFKLISRFTFDISSKTSIPPKEEPKSFVLTPKSGLYLNITEIKNN